MGVPRMDWVTTTQVLEDLKGSPTAPAWDHLFGNFHHVIVRFACRLGLSATDAEDAAQEAMIAFVTAFRNGKYQREKGRLSHWLFGVARRTILNYRKRLPREQLIADPQTGTTFWDKQPDEAAVSQSWTEEWQQMVVQKCLERVQLELDKKTFDAFRLYALCERPVKDVADDLHMTPNAVYIAKNRVLSRLRQLEEEFEGTGSD